MQPTLDTEQISVPDGLSEDQQDAFRALRENDRNIFLTGPAGSGKSYVIREWRNATNHEEYPVLASTGAAAVLVGGRTFHSFFGLGILEGGPAVALERAMKDKRLRKRLRSAKGFLIDEVSMISGEALGVADLIARHARETDVPWGGLRMIAVGDFSQLPPVTRFSGKRDWCFSSETWAASSLRQIQLQINHRVEDSSFLQILADIRVGDLHGGVRDFLNERMAIDAGEEMTAAPRLYPRRDQVDAHNFRELSALPGEVKSYPSIFFAAPNARSPETLLEQLKKNIPVRETIELKVGARVLFVQNDPQKRWVNGTRGIVTDMKEDHLTVRKETLSGREGREVKVERVSFSLLNADGETQATLLNFPLALAYAVTIHKSQGMTLTSLCTDLRRLWEPGQAYVALSRLRSPHGLFLSGWSPNSFIVDPEVVRFYKQAES